MCSGPMSLYHRGLDQVNTLKAQQAAAGGPAVASSTQALSPKPRLASVTIAHVSDARSRSAV